MISGELHDLISRGEACCVCGRTDARVWRTAPDNLIGGTEIFTAVRCVGCATVRLQPRPAPDQMVRYYTAATYARAEGEASGLSRRLDAFAEHQAARASEAFGSGFAAGRMLDVGCGDGRFLKAMSALGWTGDGIETDPIAANLARQRSAGTIFETPLEQTVFADAPYDLISLLHVLEHIPNPRETITNALRLLHAGGKLLLALPNVRCIESGIFGSSWYSLDLPRHYWGFTPQTLVRLTEECGFEEPKLRYLPFMYAPQNLRSVARHVRGSSAAQSADATIRLAHTGGGRLQTRVFLALLNASERLGRAIPGEIMEMVATRPPTASGPSLSA